MNSDVSPPWIAVFRLRFDLPCAITLRFHVTADERYRLFLDREFCGNGPERGDVECWHYETFEAELSAGAHEFQALVWALGGHAPLAQFSIRPGFLFCPDSPEHIHLATGVGNWETQVIGGWEAVSSEDAFGVGSRMSIETHLFPSMDRLGAVDGVAARTLGPAYDGERHYDFLPSEHRLFPAKLPAQYREEITTAVVKHVSILGLPTAAHPFTEEGCLNMEIDAWQDLLTGRRPLVLPARSQRRILIDLERYHTFYYRLRFCGGSGSLVRLHAQESLFADPPNGHFRRRSGAREIEGSYFGYIQSPADGLGDLYKVKSKESFEHEPLWWLAGQYVELVIETADTPLTLEELVFWETRYPLSPVASLQSNDEAIDGIASACWRTLQMCSHETYMDCPFYEQLMYIGDTRLQALLTYVMSGDERLPRKAISLLGGTHTPEGLLLSRHPSRESQMIPTFSLAWIGMVYDFAIWRDDADFVSRQLPTVRRILDAYLHLKKRYDLVTAPRGWNFVDWVPGWKDGEPDCARWGRVSGQINATLLLSLRYAVALECWHGEPCRAAIWRDAADKLLYAMTDHLYDHERGLFADDPERREFSEHTQCMLLLSGVIPNETASSMIAAMSTEGETIARVSVYYLHYLLEVCGEYGCFDRFESRLKPWTDLVKMGISTCYERDTPEESRSMCHAWSSHPLYHLFTTVCGVRPAGPGFSSVKFRAQPGSLSDLRIRFPHPAGFIEAEVARVGSELKTSISVPPGIEVRR